MLLSVRPQLKKLRKSVCRMVSSAVFCTRTCARTIECITSNDSEDRKIPSESDSLLPVHSRSPRQEGKPLTESPPGASWRTRLQEDVKILQLPFEALILSCMLGLVFHCLSSTHNLWPASKALLLSTRPEWLIPFGVAVTVAGVSYIALSVWYG